jgi:hypothetical protein
MLRSDFIRAAASKRRADRHHVGIALFAGPVLGALPWLAPAHAQGSFIAPARSVGLPPMRAGLLDRQ